MIRFKKCFKFIFMQLINLVNFLEFVLITFWIFSYSVTLKFVDLFQITLQAFHGLQIQGNLIVKTENGQYQCIRVAAPASATPGGTAVTQNSIGGNTVVAAPTAGTTYRLASVPVVSRLNTQFTGPPLATLRKPIQVTHSHTSYETRCSAVVEISFVFVNFSSLGMVLPVRLSTPFAFSCPASNL